MISVDRKEFEDQYFSSIGLVDQRMAEIDEKIEVLIKCPWGWWELKTEIWHHNPRLLITREEQREQNIKNGYPC